MSPPLIKLNRRRDNIQIITIKDTDICTANNRSRIKLTLLSFSCFFFFFWQKWERESWGKWYAPLGYGGQWIQYQVNIKDVSAGRGLKFKQKTIVWSCSSRSACQSQHMCRASGEWCLISAHCPDTVSHTDTFWSTWEERLNMCFIANCLWR